MVKGAEEFHKKFKLKEDKSQREQRIEICNTCPSFNHGLKTCKECGCFMPVKTVLKSAQCPLRKW